MFYHINYNFFHSTGCLKRHYRAECMNAFPTKYPDKHLYACLLSKADKHLR